MLNRYGGTSWEDEQRLTNDIANSYGQTISVSGSLLHLVWVSAENGVYEIRYRQSTDSGTTWGPETWLSNNSNYCFNPSITSTGPDVLIVWNDSRDGNFEIYSRRSLDGGLNWEPYMRLTNDPAISLTPSLSMSGPFVHLVWSDNREGNYKLFYKQSVDGGLSWSEDIRINNTITLSPNISSIDSLVCVVWQDSRNGIPEIFFKRSADGGITWDDDILLNDISYSSERAFIAISDPVLHVVWFDFRDGNYEIYYKRNQKGGLPVGIQNDLSGNSGQEINIYPNPATGRVLNISAGLTERSTISIKLFSISGELISEKTFQGVKGKNRFIMEFPGVATGLYLLQVKRGNEIRYFKVILN